MSPTPMVIEQSHLPMSPPQYIPMHMGMNPPTPITTQQLGMSPSTPTPQFAFPGQQKQQHMQMSYMNSPPVDYMQLSTENPFEVQTPNSFFNRQQEIQSMSMDIASPMSPSYV
jgi:hypothetical protein